MTLSGLEAYVGCPLTDAPDDFVAGVSEVKLCLRKRGINVLDFFGGKGKADMIITPAEVWDWDINRCVARAKAMLGICDLSSTGLGIEFQKAAGERGIPTLAVAREGVRVSHLVRGIPYPNFSFRTYKKLDEVPGMFITFLCEQLQAAPA